MRKLLSIFVGKKGVLVLIGLVVGFIVPIFLKGTYIHLSFSILVYVGLVGAWNILSGFTGYPFLGSAAFFGFGAYFIAFLTRSPAPHPSPGILPFYPALIVVGVLCFFIAFSLGWPFMRIRGSYFAIASYGLVPLFSSMFLYHDQMVRRVVGRYVVVQPTESVYVALYVITLIILISAFVIKSSKFGYGLSSIRGDETVAGTIGVNTTLYKSLAFGILAFFTAIIGALYIARQGYVDPTIAFDLDFSFHPLLMGILGGVGSIRGGILSAIVLSVLLLTFGTIGIPHLYFIVLGTLLFITLLWVPGGLELGLKRIF